MNGDVDWERVRRYLDDLHTASDGLGRMFPGRRFTLDGHLVGSIGEVIAAYIFDLELNPSGTPGHDARARDGRRVEIKLTQTECGPRVAIRSDPDHLIVLHRPKGGSIRVAFNGPGAPAWAAAGGMGKNGQRPISLTRLAGIAKDIPESGKLPEVRKPPDV